MARRVVRTARVALRVTPAQRRRCHGLLFAAGDVWAGLIEFNRVRFARGGPPVFGFAALCRELTGADLGPLARICAEDVAKRYSAACFETARRKQGGGRAGYPRRKRAMVPVRFRWSAFTLDGRRLRLAVTKGQPELWVRLSRDIPYDPASVRAVTLVAEAGCLYVDVSAEVLVEDHDLDLARVAGVDIGIIHPYAVVGPDGDALVMSGRALRAEERLHLEDTKRRSARMGRKAPRRGQRGSRRWRKLRAAQRRAERRHVAKIRLAHHEAAKTVIAWAVARRVGTLVVGDPKGITKRQAGRRQNRRVNTAWRRTHLTGALTDKATRAGITVVLVDERGTSSTCPRPRCHQRVPKPRGRAFTCPACGLVAHRDVIGAANIAVKGGGTIDDVPDESSTTHRRAGTVPTRRDRRRHRWDTSRAARRSSPTPGRPAATTTTAGSRSKDNRPHTSASGGGRPRRHERHPSRIATVTKTNAMEY
jgi:putative transposase